MILLKSMDDAYFMRIALEEARETLGNDLFPVGAVVVRNGEIIGQGNKCHPGHLGHAEIVAMKEAFDAKHYAHDDNIALYTTIEPCVMCFGTILYTPIKRVIFSLEDPWAGATHIKKSTLPDRYREHFPEIVGGVLREESRQILKEYARKTKKEFWRDKTNPLVKVVLGDETSSSSSS